MNITRKLAATGSMLGVLASASLAMAPTASAATLNGCAYPRVCFYLTNTDWNNRTPTAGYQDITTTYQNLSSRAAGAVVAVNSRQDDRAYLRANVSGTTRYYCLPPQGLISFAPGIVVNGIRIDSAATC
ncbi:hypothetical protein [Streptomyces sp. NPDC127118]|uniref:hypothetical protein n=1 Tax=Streptomyces sp. NPDC127118 TaxID=3345369 RepID=UPI00363E773A